MIHDEKDWIIENIRTILKEKGHKMENISKQIGISQGEFSKIINGQRKDYYKYLPQIAESLQVSFHKLVTPNQVVQNNYGSINSNGIGLVNQFHQNESKELYERIIEESKEKDRVKDELIKAEREAKESYRTKYEACKARLNKLEKRDDD